MRELFEKAASLKPRLIFFDEFELYRGLIFHINDVQTFLLCVPPMERGGGGKDVYIKRILKS